MANKATCQISLKILRDNIKSSMEGSCSYTPADATEKWIYIGATINNSSSDIITTSYTYLGTSTAIALADRVRWISIKNISSTTTDGIAICTDGGAAAWNNNHSMIIGSGEILTFKPSNVTTLGDIHAISVTMDGTYGYASGTSTANVRAEITAIVDDL